MCTRRLAMERTQWDGPCVCSQNSASVPPQILLLTVPRSKDPDSSKAVDVRGDKETRNGGGGAVVVDVVRLSGAGFGRAFGKWKVEIAVLGSKLGKYSSVIHARFQACCPPAFTPVPSAFFASTIIVTTLVSHMADLAGYPKLDEMHAAFTRPRRAIQAAIQFPEAEVIAVDVSPLPHQQIPRNMRFKQLNLTKAWDLEKQSFDMVHSRLVMTHDININCSVQTGGPATRLITSKVVEIWESRSADTDISRKYAGIMTSMGYFPRVYGHKISMPFDGTGSDGATNELDLAMKKSWTQLWETLGSRFVAEGITEAMIQEQREDICAKDCKATMDMSPQKMSVRKGYRDSRGDE
ncbi:hypothetical protein B0H14DRAFT_2580020 [Mycena olivaceomarginata]|nr:hypothetical protein B0H14DRAFT_2580020 [Mycena olivaceomarginata]